MSENAAAKAPVHLWIVGILTLLWNGFGAFDYTMSAMRDPAYMANFPPELTAMLDGFPTWATAAWAIGVWASLAGSILLLIRSRLAVPAFALSLLGAAVSYAYQMTLDLPPALSGPLFKFMPLAIMVLIAAQWFYARAQTAKGVLR